MTKNLPATEDTARFSPARLPWHPAIEEKFGALGVDKSSWKALTEAVFPGAKSADSIVMALSYCAARKLDPFKRPVHIVPMWDNNRRQMVETVWPGISEIRTTAFRTSQYAGCDEVEFGEWTEKTITGKVGKRGEERDVTVVVRFPEWGRMTVYRMLNGQRCKFVSPKVYWLESYGRMGASDVPNDMWQKRPAGQLEKCVEAAALRKAFPEEIGNDYSAEEMHGQIITGPVPSVEIEAAPPAPSAPPAPKQKDKARPAEKIEEAEIVEPAQPEETFLYADWLGHVREEFATCMTEQDVDETHEGFRDVVEERLTRNQIEEYSDLHEAALTRVSELAPAQPDAPAQGAQEDDEEAPPPPTGAGTAQPAKSGGSAPSVDDDEDEPTPAQVLHDKVAAIIARPDLTKGMLDDFVKSINPERKELKKAGGWTEDDQKRLKAEVDNAWNRLDEAERAGSQQQDDDAAGGDQAPDSDDPIEVFTRDFNAKMDRFQSTTEMQAYFSSTLKTRNGFGLEDNDPRKKGWLAKKAERLAALNG